MMKKVFFIVVSVILVLSAMIMPTFADTRSQFDFLYDNRNIEVSPSGITRNPVSDMRIDFSNDIDERAAPSGDILNISNYCRVSYNVANNKNRVYYPGYGSVRVYVSGGSVYLVYTNLANEAHESYILRYVLTAGSVPDKYVRIWWAFNDSDEPTDSVTALSIDYYAINPYNGTDVYDDQGLNEIDCTVSYPYLSKGSYENGQLNGEKSGYSYGYTNGSDEGWQRGYEEGYGAGLDKGSTGLMDFKNLIFSIFDAPFYVLATAFDFEVFGINIAATLLGIISIVALVIALRWLIPKFF